MNGENFDYQSVSEEPERLDFDNLLPCPHCKKPIPADAISCFYCGGEVVRGGKPKWVVWVVVFLILAFIFLMIF